MNTEKSNTGLSPRETSSLLYQLKSMVIGRWEKSAPEEVDAARVQSKKGLIDSLPKFIDELIETLRCPNPLSQLETKSNVAKEHGEHRASQPEYSLQDLIYEYHLLRKALIGTLKAEANIGGESLDIIHEFIDEGIQKSAAEFAKLHELKEAASKVEREHDRQQLKAAVKVARVGFYDWDIQNDRITFSPQMQDDWGIKADTSLAQVIESIHKDDQDSIRALISKAVDEHSPYNTRYRIVRPNGEVAWIEARGEITYGDDGTPLRFIGTSIEVTDQVIAQQTLKEAEKKNQDAAARIAREVESERDNLKRILESTPSPNVLWRTKDLIYERVSPSYQALFPRKVLIGKPFLEALPEPEYRHFFKIIQGVFETGKTVVMPEQLVPFDIDGTGMKDRFYTLSFFQIRDADNEPYGVYQQAEDNTEAVKARTALEFEQLKLKTVIENSTASIAVLRGHSFIYEITNKSYADLFNNRELIGKSLVEALPELVDQPFPKHAKSVFETGVPYVEREAQAFLKRTADGPLEERYFDQIYSRILDKEGRAYGIFIHAQEVTERVTARRSLQIAKDEADRANIAKSAFLANMSHEIRTPLGAIMGFSDLARDPNATPADISSYLGIVERNSVQVMRIIDDILDLAKVEAGRVELEKMEFSLTSFLADFTSLMGFRARENGISLSIKAETDLPNFVISDPTRLRQILANSVGNAIKFTTKGSVIVHVCFKNGLLHFGVEDTGRGISADQSKNLFQAFAQADASTTRKFGGTGLGLVLTKRLCQLMGGDYVLERSEIGGGSKFDASVQIDLPQSAKLISKTEVVFDRAEEKSAIQLHAGQLQGASVLLVEDSPDNQVLIRLILERQGARLDIASDGLEGVAKALSGKYDVVLMDIQMPVMDGHEAARLLRSKGYVKPVIALTAHAMKAEAERAFQSGFNNFLSKPINREALISTVSDLTKKKK